MKTVLRTQLVLWILAGLLLMALSLAHTERVFADTPVQISDGLAAHDVYISDTYFSKQLASQPDLNRLQNAVYQASQKGVSEKIAILWQIPRQYPNTAAAASALRNHLAFNGEMIVVTRRGIAVSGGDLSTGDDTAAAVQGRSLWGQHRYVDAAIAIANAAAAKAKSSKDSAFRNAAIFWLVALIIFALIVGAVLLYFRRKSRGRKERLGELRTAASNTLSLADDAVTQIESSGASMTPDVRNEYDHALGLRNRARTEVEGASSGPALTQANQDAAQAVLALQGVQKSLGLSSPLTNPIDVPTHRCFYCGRDDRPPYIQRTIDDSKGHSMDIEVCSVDAQQLERGRTPQIATVNYNGGMVPWWAVPSSPWYYGYGGYSWQYWLPFMIGMDVGGWYGGGWDGGYGYGAGYDQGFDQGSVDSGQGVPTDAGGFDAGGWGNDPGGANPTDAGGFDTGGWDSGGGGDSGGGDWGGGGDSGGGDWG